MPDKPALPGDFRSLQYVKPFVLDDGASKSLHFTRGELQSRMLTHSPWRLEVDYTRTMMGFLLFNPAPAHIGMIGLGGGSIAKFCHRFLPASRMTVLEINPYVLALRHDFQVPDDGERFQVIAADGAMYLHTESPQFDVLLVDGFDHEGQPAALCTAALLRRLFRRAAGRRRAGGQPALRAPRLPAAAGAHQPQLQRQCGRNHHGWNRATASCSPEKARPSRRAP